MKTRIEIDLNVRVRGNDTYAGFEDVTGPVSVGMNVEVFERESGLVGVGRVTEIDISKEVVYLSVEWSSLTEASAIPSREPQDPLAPSVNLIEVATQLRSGTIRQRRVAMSALLGEDLPALSRPGHSHDNELMRIC